MSRVPTDPRAAFEAWISAPPYEQSVERWPEDHDCPWPGQYKCYGVQRDWEAWQAALEWMDKP